MTQAELAQLVGVTRQTVHAIERNKYSPSLEVACRVALVFKVPLEEVFHTGKGSLNSRVGECVKRVLCRMDSPLDGGEEPPCILGKTRFLASKARIKVRLTSN